MARRKHTRPEEIISARRVRLPQEPRGSGDLSASRRVGRWLKELGLANECPSTPEAPEPKLPRITVRKTRKGYHHPASRPDIEQLLLFFGERSFYGLREIQLAQSPSTAAPGGRLFGRLYVPGRIVLYEQPIPPWYVPGRLTQAERDSLTRAGATVEQSDDGMRCIIRWTDKTLRNFMLFDVLLHEIGHHLVQQFKGKRKGQLLRTGDHEHSARLFASQCRKAYLGSARTDA